MLNWISGYVGRWAGRVEAAILDVLHWGLHAVAGVMYAVFANVGKAWARIAGAAWRIETAVHDFAYAIWVQIWRIIRHDIPQLLHWAAAQLNVLWRLAWHLYAVAARDISIAYHAAVNYTYGLYKWVLAHVWAPLVAAVAIVRRDLVAWGYTAWWWITHPAQLADRLLDYLVASLERNSWRVAGTLGTFASHLIFRNIRRLAALAEDVIAAIL
jgi:hypothetical protein